MVRYLPDGIWNNFSRQYKEERKLLFFTFVLGCTLYLRMIVQWLANPDGVWQGLVYKPGYAWEDMLGSMGLGMFNRFKGYYQFPTLQTLFCIFTAALTAVLLCSLLEIKKHPWDYIAGGLVVCSPSLCSTLTYYCTADAYLLAFLFSVLFVWCLAKGDTWKSYAVAVFLLAASACIYQAYIGSAITLCLLYLLLNIMRNTVPPRNLLGKFFRFLTAGACASALYLVSYKLVCRWRELALYLGNSPGSGSREKQPHMLRFGMDLAHSVYGSAFCSGALYAGFPELHSDGSAPYLHPGPAGSRQGKQRNGLYTRTQISHGRR